MKNRIYTAPCCSLLRADWWVRSELVVYYDHTRCMEVQNEELKLEIDYSRKFSTGTRCGSSHDRNGFFVTNDVTIPLAAESERVRLPGNHSGSDCLVTKTKFTRLLASPIPDNCGVCI